MGLPVKKYKSNKENLAVAFLLDFFAFFSSGFKHIFY
ncbi:hypothetical protein SAMN05192533_101205 [Mesobacillus persicus]|uniref:Uncharacterized protein n=1 Tax=Mesobacillus persicus TaxID=930146 RepID=A0A1H7VZM0_9BACI|nr:hypothetical protein SAMN05192533_101205 [Mesobacillus persicus]